MSMAIGRGLSALGGGMMQWGNDLRARREKEEETALRLQMAGYRPTPAGQATTSRMGEVEPMAAPLGAAASAMTGGPTGSALGAPVAELARALSSVRRPPMPDPEEPALPSRPPVTLGGATYEFDPTATPEYQREALQRSLREPGNRRAYQQIAQTFDGIGEYNPEVDYAQVQQQNMGSSLRRRPDPQRNRQAYDMIPADAFPGGRKPAYAEDFDWSGAANRYVGGEMGQQNRTEFRVSFPPSAGGGGGGGGGADRDPLRGGSSGINFFQDIARDLIDANGGDPVKAMNDALGGPYRDYFVTESGGRNDQNRNVMRSILRAEAERYKNRRSSQDIMGDIYGGLNAIRARTQQ